MFISKIKCWGFGLVAGVMMTAGVHAASYPERPITMIVPFAAGGPTDKVAREIGQIMSQKMGVSIVVENVGGAGGTIGARKAATSTADGYTILVHHIGMATAPALYRNLGYDPLKDFAYVGEVADVPMLIVANKKLPPDSFSDLLAYIKTNSSDIILANAGAGSASHLCGLLFQDTLKVKLLEVPYKGAAPALTDLIGGQVNLMCDQTTNLASQVNAGMIKAYAAVQPERIPAFKNIPSINEAGMPGLEVKVWHAMYAPKGTPPEITAKLSRVLQEAVVDPSFVNKMAELGATAVPANRATPQSLETLLTQETKKWGAVIKRAGIEPN